MNEKNKERKINTYCERCNLQTAAIIVASHVKTSPLSLREAAINPVDTPYYVVEYSIALCSKCERVFLVESVSCELPGEFCTPQEENILYPTNRKLSIDGMPENTARAYTAASRSYQAGLYEPCVIMCRKCIEALCQELGATKGNLKQRLEKLRSSGQIDKKLSSWADELRLIGNDAAHDLDIIIEQNDAQDALEFVEAILMYAFSLTRKFEEFKNRRASKSPERKIETGLNNQNKKDSV